MKKIIAIFLPLLFSLQGIGQINKADSTVQCVAYWRLHEKHTYSVFEQKLKIEHGDTTSRDIINYNVDISILDSTASSYQAEWYYHDFGVSTKNDALKTVMAVANNMKVIVATDELGIFKGVVNWKDIKAYIEKGIGALKKQYKDAPTMVKLINQVESMYSSKEAIEASAISEILQYYSFFGVKYKLGEPSVSKIKVPNGLGGEPLDADYTYYLDQIDETDNNYILRSTQVIDSVALTNATFDYLVKTMKVMGMPAPKREDIKNISNETLLGSRIHNGGWLMYSIQTKTVTSDKVSNSDETIIKLE